MRRRTPSIVLGIAAAGLLIAGCSSSPPPPRQSADSSDSPSSSPTSSSASAPHVAKPLDTSKFQAAPCTMLQSAQLQQFGLSTPGDPKADATGPNCHWSNLDSGVSLDVGFVTGNKDGLSALYGKRSSLDLFTVLPDIDGYPAVIYGVTDNRSRGTCNVDVGVSDSLNFDAMVQAANGPLKSDPCSAAKQIAGMVVKTLAGGS
ncbi:DUF3558 domain-containing protein [Solihabitans fulvus]|uniref:DUF3558 domain-containing protein n=1 Tax=Solihabitans fulvus TaxID=1892852 RepID=UPI001661B090|nr:DUF3558 domain-containing protein [Solihabitans fulvus]